MYKIMLTVLICLLAAGGAFGAITEDVQTTDVVVVGGGGAGLAAAIEASELGAEVLVLEKLPFLGGSTLLSGGGLSGAGHQFQKEAGITDDSPELLLEDLLREGQFKNNLSLAKTFADRAGEAIDWMADLGCDFVLLPHEAYPEHTVQRSVSSIPGRGDGSALIQALQAAAEERDVDIRLNHLVTELLTNTSGTVIGVQAETAGGTQTVLAERVVLATGGFVGNEDMLMNYAPEIVDMDPAVVGFTELQGEGIILGQEAGAALENMEYIKVYPTGGRTDDGDDVYVAYQQVTPLGAILVNREGQRFVQETPGTFVEVWEALQEQTDQRMFLIFDDYTMQQWLETDGPLVMGWSQERTLQDFEEQTLFRKSEDIEELGEKLHVDSSALVETVNEAGLDEGPYYGVEMLPNLIFTLGGLRINDDAQALDAEGQAIAGLYAAGEIAGAGHGAEYMSGNAISYAIVFGRIAGENAARDALQDR